MKGTVMLIGAVVKSLKLLRPHYTSTDYAVAVKQSLNTLVQSATTTGSHSAVQQANTTLHASSIFATPPHPPESPS